jgi:hypothetical protein
MQRYLIGLALIAAGVALVLVLNRRSEEAANEEPKRPPDHSQGERGVWPDIASGASRLDAGTSFDESPGESTFDSPDFDLAELDFESLRQRTPDSLYWLMAAPTKDPAILEARRNARAVRNEQYGRVVSNTASVEEIRDYYAYRRKLSEDYIEVAQLILEEHGGSLSERDFGLFELAISMHSAALSEIPGKLSDALQRKEQYDRVKQAWKAQQESEAAAAADNGTNSR